MDPEKIGKFIYELRKEKNLSQYQLADLIPISRQGVSKWERGKTTPDTQTLIRLSELFDVSINELLKGERLENNTIEDLEETTLSILDQSNKKTKIIKHITTISISIITILLLTFLSYYFINSYNSTEVYTIYGQSKNFTTYDGLMIITKERMYLKLGKLKNKNNLEIENIKLYYMKNNKKIKIVEDQEADNIVIKDYTGYYSKIKELNSQGIIDNIYIEITYNDNQKETIKLKYTSDYKNSSLFFIKQHDEIKKNEDPEPQEEKQELKEEKKEETQPTIQETQQENIPENNNQVENKPKEEPKQEEQQPQEPQEPEQQELVITTDMVINKIKEVCPETNGSYSCEYDNQNILLMYYPITNKIALYKNGSMAGQYFVNMDNYMCTVSDCETVFNETYKQYLFS